MGLFGALDGFGYFDMDSASFTQYQIYRFITMACLEDMAMYDQGIGECIAVGCRRLGLFF